jgi:NAD(P)-dependent dehydrogenase (short-subunit alcohol dehydrogenase family)
MKLQGKAVVLTGASRGLGRALAVELAREGAHLALVARDAQALEETANLCLALQQAGAMAAPKPVLVCADITRVDENQRMVDEAVAALGRLDLFIANAGLSMWADFIDVEDLSLYQRLLEVNYLAVVYGIHAALPHLMASKGRIVAISSAQAWTGMAHHSGYSASKAALQAFLDSLTMEIGNQVGVLGVYPGWIRGTDLRNYALGADGLPLGATSRTHNSLSVSAEECSKAVVRALHRDSRSLFVPGYLRLLQMGRPFGFPIIARILGGAIKSQPQAGKDDRAHPA